MRLLRLMLRLIRKPVSWGIFLLGLTGISDEMKIALGWFGVAWTVSKPWVGVFVLHEAAIRWAVVAVALVLIAWEHPAFRLVRFRAKIRVRRAILSDPEWINREQALEAVQASNYIRSRRDPMAGLSSSLFGGGSQMKLSRFSMIVLDSFAANNPDFARTEAGVRQYRLDKLSQFLAAAFDADVIEKFGSPPTIRVL